MALLEDASASGALASQLPPLGAPLVSVAGTPFSCSMDLGSAPPTAGLKICLALDGPAWEALQADAAKLSGLRSAVAQNIRVDPAAVVVLSGAGGGETEPLNIVFAVTSRFGDAAAVQALWLDRTSSGGVATAVGNLGGGLSLVATGDVVLAPAPGASSSAAAAPAPAPAKVAASPAFTLTGTDAGEPTTAFPTTNNVTAPLPATNAIVVELNGGLAGSGFLSSVPCTFPPLQLIEPMETLQICLAFGDGEILLLCMSRHCLRKHGLATLLLTNLS